MKSENYIATSGKGKGTKYFISPTYQIIRPIDAKTYYEKEIDERKIKNRFNFGLIRDVLGKHDIFSSAELEKLNGLQNQ